MRSLLPPSILLTTIITTKNPLRVIIQHNAHITLDIITILRVTPEFLSSSTSTSRKNTILSFLMKPLFAPPRKSSMESEVDDRESFVLVYRWLVWLTSSCLMRYRIFYCTGDLNGIQTHRTAHFTTITNWRLRHTPDLFSLFDIPEVHCPSSFDPVPVFYDVQCHFQQLHFTVEYDEDEEGMGFLRITVRIHSSALMKSLNSTYP